MSDVTDLHIYVHSMVQSHYWIPDQIVKEEDNQEKDVLLTVLCGLFCTAGFKEQIYDVYRYLPPATQVVLISATLPHEILEMTNKFMTDPIRILVKRWVSFLGENRNSELVQPCAVHSINWFKCTESLMFLLTIPERLQMCLHPVFQQGLIYLPDLSSSVCCCSAWLPPHPPSGIAVSPCGNPSFTLTQFLGSHRGFF